MGFAHGTPLGSERADRALEFFAPAKSAEWSGMTPKNPSARSPKLVSAASEIVGPHCAGMPGGAKPRPSPGLWH